MPSEDPARRFRDIVENIERIERHVRGLDLVKLFAHQMALDAVERCLARISEAASKLGSEAERLCPELPWHGIRRLGNYLRHEYERVDHSRLWAIITSDLQTLKSACRDALTKLDDQRG